MILLTVCVSLAVGTTPFTKTTKSIWGREGHRKKKKKKKEEGNQPRGTKRRKVKKKKKKSIS